MLDLALKHLISGIVTYPDEVKVVSQVSSNGETLSVYVNPEDIGRVIGKSGRTIRALRNVINAISDNGNVRLDIVDLDRN